MSSPLLGFATAGLAMGAEILVRKKRGFANLNNSGDNDIVFVGQIVEEESHHDAMVITNHPVQLGATVSDHMYKLPAEVTLRYGWSNSPTPGLLMGALGIAAGQAGALVGKAVGLGQAVAAGAGIGIGAFQQVDAVYTTLLGMQASKVIFDLYTGKRLYPNMVIQEISTETDSESEHSMTAVIRCKEIIIARTAVINTFGKSINKGAKQAVQK